MDYRETIAFHVAQSEILFKKIDLIKTVSESSIDLYEEILQHLQELKQFESQGLFTGSFSASEAYDHYCKSHDSLLLDLSKERIQDLLESLQPGIDRDEVSVILENFKAKLSSYQNRCVQSKDVDRLLNAMDKLARRMTGIGQPAIPLEELVKLTRIIMN
ncbi:MAG: hypothetical protein ACM3MI_03845 [Clostridiales bacterium]